MAIKCSFYLFQSFFETEEMHLKMNKFFLIIFIYFLKKESTFSNYFRRLLEQCDTKSLSFGKLRKHFSTWLRNKGESELASMAVQHGNPTEDKLLHHYSNKPYKRYFQAQLDYREHLGIEEAIKHRSA